MIAGETRWDCPRMTAGMGEDECIRNLTFLPRLWQGGEGRCLCELVVVSDPQD